MVERISSEKIPAAVGSYSAASKVGNLILHQDNYQLMLKQAKFNQNQSNGKLHSHCGMCKLF